MTDNIDVVATSEGSDASGVATPASDSEAQIEEKQRIPSSAISRGVQGVGSVLKLPDDQIRTIIDVLIHDHHVDNLFLEEWLETVTQLAFNDDQRQILNVAIALAFLRQSGRADVVVSPAHLELVWTLIKCGLQSPSLPWQISRSAQGLHAIPLWSFIVDGRIDELIRLHIWLPDGVRANPDLAIHMHQPHAQSWILAGEGTDNTFDVVPADQKGATHAVYQVGWAGPDSKESDRAYKVHSKSSTVTNTGKLVCVTQRQADLHTRNMTYHIPAGVYHSSVVEPDALHATLLFFDSHRGYIHDAPVIGPIAREPVTHDRKPANLSIDEVANIIADLRSWEIHQEIGQEHSDRGEWEEALRSFRTALHICRNNKWLDSPRYLHVTLGKLGHKYRMLGLCQKACECLEEVVVNAPLSRFRVDCIGELATVYRHMDRLEDCKRMSETQYLGAKQLNLEKYICRAAGTLGMVTYQLYLLNKDVALLDSAIGLLQERVERAQQLEDVALEAIGQGRLSLCYLAKGDFEKAVSTARNNYDLMFLQNDTTKQGFARAFLGRTLLLAGHRDEALALFNPVDGCPPVIALCKEISAEHRQYIIEIIAAGANLKLRDEQGYSALECAVYNGDRETAQIIEDGLRAQIASEGGDVIAELTQLQYEATLRKGYRELFQDKLRPVLLEREGESRIEVLRRTYAEALDNDNAKRDTFDRFKYVRFADFQTCRRLPRSSDPFTQDHIDLKEGTKAPFVLFFSYRWIANDPGSQSDGDSPDNVHHTQYNRMLRAVELFLQLHPEVDREQLCIWIVSKKHWRLEYVMLMNLGFRLHRSRQPKAGCRCLADESCTVRCYDKLD
jgi:tetratricopeptide (TPR) repeat protein